MSTHVVKRGLLDFTLFVNERLVCQWGVYYHVDVTQKDQDTTTLCAARARQ